MAESCNEMKDVGSIFPLYEKDLVSNENTVSETKRIHFSLCREALYAVAQSLDCTNKVVLMPAYTCDTVYMPFKQLGWKCCYYSVNRDLYANTQSIENEFKLHHPALFIIHPYFGQGLSEPEKQTMKVLHDAGCKILVDNTQCVFSEERLPYVDCYTGSYRKWFPISDGGFLESTTDTITKPEEENTIFCSLQKGAMYLRGEYFINENEVVKQLSIQLNKAADLHSCGEITPHRMSDFSEFQLRNQDIGENKKARFDNYAYLHNNLPQNHLKFVSTSIDNITSAPLYFPIYLENRRDVQIHLAQHHIYLPVIWPVDEEEVLIDDEVKYIYQHILCIPVDQRYDIQDMELIVNLINDFYEKDSSNRS